jgi:branched-chain amino acid transport system ATP-binding protein
MAAVLEARDVCVGYGHVPVLKNVNLEVGAGEVVALLGPNGAGKTTTVLALSGVLPLTQGEVLWEGEPATEPLHKRVRKGLSLVTEDRSIIMRLSVRDNLRLARVPVERATDMFPELATRLNVKAGNLSGGEQQMLTLSRALGREPKVLLADELSMGLAPIVVHRLLETLRQHAVRDGVGVLVVEQHVSEVLGYADRAYVLSRGSIEMSGTSEEVRSSAANLEAAYLGR